jgi:hypothetical protein
MSYHPDGMAMTRLSARDWLFGAGGKRRLLEALLAAAPGRRWTEAELARAAGLHAKGSVDVHLLALVQLGVLVRSGGDYELVPRHPLVRPLRLVVEALAAVEDRALERPGGPARG